MDFRPLGDRLVVQRVEKVATTKGGVVIPDSAIDLPTEGRVLAVGRGWRAEDGSITPLEIQKGDMVLFGKYAGQDVTLADGTAYLVLREGDVLGIIDGL